MKDTSKYGSSALCLHSALQRNFFAKVIQTAMVAGAVVFACGCSTPAIQERSDSSSEQATSLKLNSNSTLADDLSHALAGKKLSGVATLKGQEAPNRWVSGLVIASEKEGLVQLPSGDTAQGEYELLDARETQTRQWLITADAQTGQPLLFTHSIQSGSESNAQTENKTLLSHPPAALREATFQLDAVCLYLDPQRNVFAFMLDGYGGGEMRWLWDARTDSLVDITVKSLSLPPGSESCTVDDASASLLVVEEEFGVWRYPAEPEGAWQRQLVQAVKPWGELPFPPLGVSHIAPWHIALFGENQLEVYRLGEAEASAKKVYRASVNAEELAGVVWLNDQLVAIDEGADRLVLDSLSAAKIQPVEDSVNLTAKVYPTVVARAQTPAMERRGDAADDPAIWLHPTHPEKSLVLGTNKKWGLFVYDLQGHTQQSIATGHINNVDVRQGLQLNVSHPVDIAVASNRSDNTLTLYTINPKTGRVAQAANVPTGLDDVYGVCLYSPNPNTAYAFINDKDGRFKQYQILHTSNGLDAQLVREFALHSQPEACVVNDATADLFIGEENVGVWLFNAEPNATISGRLLAATGDVLVADVEGLALVNNALGHYLVVSSQGDNSYALYQAQAPFKYLGSFRVGLNSDAVIDGTSETDGLEVHGGYFSEEYPHGLLVIQDGFNLMPSQPQNFKYVSWEEVVKTLQLKAQ